MLDLHTFLDLDRNTDGVDTRFNHAYILITLEDHDWLTEEGLVVLEFNLRMDLTLNDLRREVAQVKNGLQVQPDVPQVVVHSLCHIDFSAVFIIKNSLLRSSYNQ